MGIRITRRTRRSPLPLAVLPSFSVRNAQKPVDRELRHNPKWITSLRLTHRKYLLPGPGREFWRVRRKQLKRTFRVRFDWPNNIARGAYNMHRTIAVYNRRAPNYPENR